MPIVKSFNQFLKKPVLLLYCVKEYFISLNLFYKLADFIGFFKIKNDF